MSRTRRPAAAAVLAVCFAAGTPGLAAGPGLRDIGSFSGFDHIRTNGAIDYNLGNGTFAIPQRFEASRSGTDISADRADGNSKQRQMHATGNVVVHQNQAVADHGDQTTQFTQKPSTLTCDKLDVDGMRKLYVATGSVHFKQLGGREATSDSAQLNDVTNQLHMQGHVHIKDGDQTLDGDVVDYNTATGQVHAEGAPLITTVPLETPGPLITSPPRTKKRRR